MNPHDTPDSSPDISPKGSRMTPPITDKQSALLMFCAEFFAKNDQLPPFYVAANHFGWASVNAAVEMMEALRRKGYVARNQLGKYRFTPEGRAYITDRSERSRWHPMNGTAEPINGNEVSYSAG